MIYSLCLQQIHFPAHRQFRLPVHRTQIGSYPLALLPGQYHDAFVEYTPDELKYMPVNTALFYYPKPVSLVQPSRFSQGSLSDEEEESQRKSRISHIRPATPQSPVLLNGMTRSVKPTTPNSLNSQTNVCHICKVTDENNDDDWMNCSTCHHQFHSACLEVNNEMLNIIKTYPWQCIDCKNCAKCNKMHDEVSQSKVYECCLFNT
jgi:BRG1-associated factor 45A